MLERDVEKSGAGVGQRVVTVANLRAHMDAPAAALRDPGSEGENAVDENRLSVANEHAHGHGGEAVPRRQQPAGLVQRGSDEPAVDDPRPRLMALAEREARLVSLDPLVLRPRQMEAVRILVAAAPALGIVVRRNLRYRKPPRSRCAL